MRTNNIYIYTDELLRPLGEYKIGETAREVSVRIKEQDTTSNARDLEEVAKYKVSGFITDKMIHNELELLGYTKVRKNREWFKKFNDDTDVQVAIQNVIYNLGGKILNPYEPYFYKTIIAEKIFTIYEEHKHLPQITIPGDLAARSGKTTFAIQLLEKFWSEYNYKVCILPSYYLSSHSSFEKDLGKYVGFRDNIHFIGRRDNLEVEFKKYYGKKVLVIEHSLHQFNSIEELEEKYKVLSGIPKNEKMSLVDEADWGAWKNNQIEEITWFDCHLYLPLSGTGIEKIIHSFPNVVDYVSFPYIEMVMMKQGNHHWLNTLSEEERKKAIDTLQNIVIPRFFQLNLDNAKEKTSSVPNEYKTKWSKLLSDIDGNEAILEDLIRGLYGKYNGVNPNLMGIGVSSHCKLDVSMIFANTRTKKEQEKLRRLLERIFTNTHDVILLNTDQRISNKSAEDKVEKQIANSKRNGRRVIILTKDMGSRSFSVTEIDTVFLMFDQGDISAVKQKVSRVLTGGGRKEFGNVVSLSLDPNRTENPIQDYIISESETIDSDDLHQSIRQVLLSVNVFTNENNGIITEVDIDQYGEELLNSSSLINVGLSTINLENLPDDIDLEGIIIAKLKVESRGKVDISKAITFVDKKGNEVVDEKEKKKFKDNLLEKIKSVVINSMVYTEINNLESDTIRGTLNGILEKELDDEVLFEVGIGCKTIEKLLDNEVISEKMMNTIISSYNKQELNAVK